LVKPIRYVYDIANTVNRYVIGGPASVPGNEQLHSGTYQADTVL